MTDFGGAITQSPEYDVAILGIPYDEKSSYLKGPAKGPQVIREASTSKAINAWTELHVNLEEEIVMVDLGDVDVSGDFTSLYPRNRPNRSLRHHQCRNACLSDRQDSPLLAGDHRFSRAHQADRPSKHAPPPRPSKHHRGLAPRSALDIHDTAPSGLHRERWSRHTT